MSVSDISASNPQRLDILLLNLENRTPKQVLPQILFWCLNFQPLELDLTQYFEGDELDRVHIKFLLNKLFFSFLIYLPMVFPRPSSNGTVSIF